MLGRSGAQGHGLALLMRRGVSAWMQAWSQCVASPPVTVLPLAPVQGLDDQGICPVQLHREVVTLVANMVLFTRQEVPA